MCQRGKSRFRVGARRFQVRKIEVSVGRGEKHILNAQSVMDSFAAVGVICGVVGPCQSSMEVMRQADVVVLDWLLKEGDPEYALGLLCDLLTKEADRNSLRLVAIYTGEARLEEICTAIFTRLKNTGLEYVEKKNKTAISYQHGSVVLYAKPDVNLPEPLKERSVAEGDLPKRLVEDFSAMTEGLLPSIALTSLTAVRESAHLVLDQFSADLDPAFLAHRACLSNPDDAERQIVNHVAEELRGLMDNAVAAQSPAGAEAVEGWIRSKNGGARRFMFGEKELDLNQTIALGKKGLEASELKNSAFGDLSAGFADSGVVDVDLDERLAWIMRLSDGVQRTTADVVAGICRHGVDGWRRKAPDLHEAPMRLRQAGGGDFLLFPTAG